MVKGTLSTISKKVLIAKIKPPSIIIVGNVVKLSDKIGRQKRK